MPQSALQDRLPIALPLLPSAEAVAPYLRRMDAARRYSNHGPLVRELEARLAFGFGVPGGSVIACANGTLALGAAITAARAFRPRPGRTLCLVPAYTYVATAAAAQAAGLSLHIVDVDAQSWALDPQALRSHPRLEEVAVVVPVAPYGRAPDLEAWAQFAEDTGIAVAIDGAACFEWFWAEARQVPPGLPVAVSLHATKSFGCGEGGLVVASDTDTMRAVHAALNFGFLGTRIAQTPGINGKMSEYHASVAHAELDGWAAKAATWSKVAQTWREGSSAIHSAPKLAVCYALYQAVSPEAAAHLVSQLDQAGIDSLFWYGGGIAQHPAYADWPSDPLPNTTSLCQTLIGLPSFVDLPRDRILGILQEVIIPAEAQGERH